MQAEVTTKLMVQYCYPVGVLPIVVYIDVESRDPESIQCVGGAISFDYVELTTLRLADGTVKKFTNVDEHTYYWGQELSLAEVESLPAYEGNTSLGTTERFVLTSWGALIPLCAYELVVPDTVAFELPPDMRLDP